MWQRVRKPCVTFRVKPVYMKRKFSRKYVERKRKIAHVPLEPCYGRVNVLRYPISASLPV